MDREANMEKEKETIHCTRKRLTCSIVVALIIVIALFVVFGKLLQIILQSHQKRVHFSLEIGFILDVKVGLKIERMRVYVTSDVQVLRVQGDSQDDAHESDIYFSLALSQLHNYS